MASALIRRWNRQNPGRCIDENTSYNQGQVDALFAGIASEIPLVSLDIQEPLMRAYAANPSLGDDERTLRAYLADGFVINASKLLWCILAKSRGQPEYDGLIGSFGASFPDSWRKRQSRRIWRSWWWSSSGTPR